MRFTRIQLPRRWRSSREYVLLRINNQKIEDVFDYRYMIKDEYVEVLIRKPDGEEWLLEIEKEYDDDLGVEFENSLMERLPFLQQQVYFLFYRPDAAGNA